MGVLVCNDVLNGTQINPLSTVKKIRSLVKKAKEPASPEEIAKIKESGSSTIDKWHALVLGAR